MTERRLSAVSTLVELVGLLLVVVGLAQVAVWLGCVAAGVVLVVVAFLLDPGRRAEPDNDPLL